MYTIDLVPNPSSVTTVGWGESELTATVFKGTVAQPGVVVTFEIIVRGDDVNYELQNSAGVWVAAAVTITTDASGHARTRIRRGGTQDFPGHVEIRASATDPSDGLTGTGAAKVIFGTTLTTDHFRIHYIPAGSSAPPGPCEISAADVQTLANTLEESYGAFIARGYCSHPNELAGWCLDTPLPHTCVLVKSNSVGGAYTIPFDEHGIQSDGYITVRNQPTTDPIHGDFGNYQVYTQRYASHEFFHVIQFRYNDQLPPAPPPPAPDYGLWWAEASAEWAISAVYSAAYLHADYYYLYLDYPQRQIDLWINQVGVPAYQYGRAIFCKHLEEHVDRDIVRRVWEYMYSTPQPNGLLALDALCGHDVGARFKTFSIANCFNDPLVWPRYGYQYWDNNARYKKAAIASQTEADGSWVHSSLPEHLDAHYDIIIPPSGVPGPQTLEIYFRGGFSAGRTAPAVWGIYALGLRASYAGDASDDVFELKWTNPVGDGTWYYASGTVPDFGSSALYRAVELVPSNVTYDGALQTQADGLAYEYRARLVP